MVGPLRKSEAAGRAGRALVAAGRASEAAARASKVSLESIRGIWKGDGE